MKIFMFLFFALRTWGEDADSFSTNNPAVSYPLCPLLFLLYLAATVVNHN
jgi:hypothetical protein